MILQFHEAHQVASADVSPAKATITFRSERGFLKFLQANQQQLCALEMRGTLTVDFQPQLILTQKQ